MHFFNFQSGVKFCHPTLSRIPTYSDKISLISKFWFIEKGENLNIERFNLTASHPFGIGVNLGYVNVLNAHAWFQSPIQSSQLEIQLYARLVNSCLFVNFNRFTVYWRFSLRSEGNFSSRI